MARSGLGHSAESEQARKAGLVPCLGCVTEPGTLKTVTNLLLPSFVSLMRLLLSGLLCLLCHVSPISANLPRELPMCQAPQPHFLACNGVQGGLVNQLFGWAGGLFLSRGLNATFVLPKSFIGDARDPNPVPITWLLDVNDTIAALCAAGFSVSLDNSALDLPVFNPRINVKQKKWRGITESAAVLQPHLRAQQVMDLGDCYFSALPVTDAEAVTFWGAFAGFIFAKNIRNAAETAVARLALKHGLERLESPHYTLHYTAIHLRMEQDMMWYRTVKGMDGLPLMGKSFEELRPLQKLAAQNLASWMKATVPQKPQGPVFVACGDPPLVAQFRDVLGANTYTKADLIGEFSDLWNTAERQYIGAAIDLYISLYAQYAVGYKESSFSAYIAALHSIPLHDLHYAYPLGVLTPPPVLRSPNHMRSWARHTALCIGRGLGSCSRNAPDHVGSHTRAAYTYSYQIEKSAEGWQVRINSEASKPWADFPILAPPETNEPGHRTAQDEPTKPLPSPTRDPSIKFTGMGMAFQAIEELYSMATHIDPHPVSDKFTDHAYEHMYGLFLGRLLGGKQRFKMLEIGLGCGQNYGPGASLYLWNKLFPVADIWFAEYNAECVFDCKARGLIPKTAKILLGDQANFTVLNGWIAESKGAFDVIIDDGGHSSRMIGNSFTALWPTIQPGGLYFIEDLWIGRMAEWNLVDNGLPIPDILECYLEQLIVAKPRQQQCNFSMPVDVAFILCQAEACVLGKSSQPHGGNTHSSRLSRRLSETVPIGTHSTAIQEMHRFATKVSPRPTSDKSTVHSYEMMYGLFLGHFMHTKHYFRLFEVGVGCGVNIAASVHLWRGLFPAAELWFAESDGICDAEGTAKGSFPQDAGVRYGTLDGVSGGRFEVIIDADGHNPKRFNQLFPRLWPMLQPGGLYFVENLQASRSPMDSPDGQVSDVMQCYVERLLLEQHPKPCVFARPDDLGFVFCQHGACVLGKSLKGHKGHTFA